MNVITIKRIIRKSNPAAKATSRQRLYEFARRFFATENHWEFALEALLFAALIATAAWPILAAASAINQLL